MSKMLLENLKTYFPFLANDIQGWVKNDEWGITVRTRQGETFFYDDYEHTIRRLPAYSSDITEEESRMEFGYRLRRLMYKKGMTQTELADLAGIQRTQLNNYINGKTSPSFYIVDRIAKALGCSTDDLRYI